MSPTRGAGPPAQPSPTPTTAPGTWSVRSTSTRVEGNTLVISGLGILFGFPAPIALALLINEIGGTRFRKITQTISYVPHFVSWVVTASIIFTILGNEGLLNDVLLKLGLI